MTTKRIKPFHSDGLTGARNEALQEQAAMREALSQPVAAADRWLDKTIKVLDLVNMSAVRLHVPQLPDEYAINGSVVMTVQALLKEIAASRAAQPDEARLREAMRFAIREIDPAPIGTAAEDTLIDAWLPQFLAAEAARGK